MNLYKMCSPSVKMLHNVNLFYNSCNYVVSWKLMVMSGLNIQMIYSSIKCLLVHRMGFMNILESYLKSLIIRISIILDV
jgi:hypothetical protein